MSLKWNIDPTHSEIQFRVKHLMITTVTGYFTRFDLDLQTATEDFESASVINFTADIDSLDTNNEQRDNHLKSPDFFNVEEHPKLTFVGKKYENNKLIGDLTVRGTTKPVTLNADFSGLVVDPFGQTRAGFTLDGKLSRKEFGLTWNTVTEAGNVVVGDEVKIHAELQLLKQA